MSAALRTILVLAAVGSLADAATEIASAFGEQALAADDECSHSFGAEVASEPNCSMSAMQRYGLRLFAPEAEAELPTIENASGDAAHDTNDTNNANGSLVPACGAGWQQCGGKTWTGPTCCEPPYKCFTSGDYYSQCGKNADDYTTTTTTFIMSPDRCGQNAYVQCGGSVVKKQQKYHGMVGDDCCFPGYHCFRESKLYSYCIPLGNTTASQPYEPREKSLEHPSTASLFTFYMYRVSKDDSHYTFSNVNAGTLPGILWYLHNEVVWLNPRKFNISLIKRYKVQTRATTPLLKAGMNFGVRYAFDEGECTGPFSCDDKWNRFGYFVGCNNLGDWPFPDWPVQYPDAIWYSLPGKCPSKRYMDQTPECKDVEPGGLVSQTPTGSGISTYTYEEAGTVSIDELVGIDDALFNSTGDAVEYNRTTDEGVGTTFWNGINNTKLNMERIKKAKALFQKHYPDMPHDDDLPAPPCDFNHDKFFYGKEMPTDYVDHWSEKRKQQRKLELTSGATIEIP